MHKSDACNVTRESHRRAHHASEWALQSRTAQIPACWTPKHCPHGSTTILTGIAHSDFQSGDTQGTLHPALLKSALHWPGGPHCFPSGESIFASPHFPPLSLTSPSFCSWPECYHLLTDNSKLWIFIHCFEMLVRPSCFPPSTKLTLWSFDQFDMGKHGEAMHQFV